MRDEATVLHATFVYAAGPKGKVFADDIVGLAGTMARKMKAEEK